jgi:hypothetical protein
MPLSTVLGAQSLVQPAVCTTATRPASPYTGQAIYDTTLSQTLVYNGSAWVVQSGGLVFITSTTFSAASTFSINNCFSSAYFNYRILIRSLGAGGATELRYRLRVGGTDNSSANYSSQRLYAQNTSVGGYNEINQTSGFLYTTNSTDISASSTEIFRPFEAATTHFHTEGKYNDYGIDLLAGRHLVSTSYDGITIFPQSGTITGEIFIYGYAK